MSTLASLKLMVSKIFIVHILEIELPFRVAVLAVQTWFEAH